MWSAEVPIVEVEDDPKRSNGSGESLARGLSSTSVARLCTRSPPCAIASNHAPSTSASTFLRLAARSQYVLGDFVAASHSASAGSDEWTTVASIVDGALMPSSGFRGTVSVLGRVGDKVRRAGRASTRRLLDLITVPVLSAQKPPPTFSARLSSVSVPPLGQTTLQAWHRRLVRHVKSGRPYRERFTSRLWTEVEEGRASSSCQRCVGGSVGPQVLSSLLLSRERGLSRKQQAGVSGGYVFFGRQASRGARSSP